MKKWFWLLFLGAILQAQVQNPSVKYVPTAPSGSCAQAPPVQVLNSSGDIYTCDDGTWTDKTGGSGSGTVSSGTAGQCAYYASSGTTVSGTTCATNAQWARQVNPVISPLPTDPSLQVQEPSMVLSSSPELLTSYNYVVKSLFADGWINTGAGGTGIGICYGESPAGTTAFTRGATCPLTALVGYREAALMANPTGAGYILYAVNLTTNEIDEFTSSTTVEALTLANSSIVECGQAGTNQISGSWGKFEVVYKGTNSWLGFQDCASNAAGASGSFAIWEWTSTNGSSWTLAQTTPVIGYGSGVVNTNCEDGSGLDAHFIGSVLYGWFHCGPAGETPTPYIYRVVDATGAGNAFVLSSAPSITARTPTEGVNLSTGQIANVSIVDLTSAGINESVLFDVEYSNGCPAQADCWNPSYVEALVINEPLSTIVTQAESDSPSSVQTPLSSGLYQLSGFQAFDDFNGNAGTLLSAHSDVFGHTWSDYTPITTDTGTSATLTGSYQATAASGASSTNAEYLNSAIPGSPNYSVNMWFTPATSSAGAARLYARAQNSSENFYFVYLPATGGISLYKVVAGTATQIGTTCSFTPTAHKPFLLSLIMGTGTQTVNINGASAGAGCQGTDTSITAAGQAGFGMNGNSLFTAGDFWVQ